MSFQDNAWKKVEKSEEKNKVRERAVNFDI